MNALLLRILRQYLISSITDMGKKSIYIGIALAVFLSALLFKNYFISTLGRIETLQPFANIIWYLLISCSIIVMLFLIIRKNKSKEPAKSSDFISEMNVRLEKQFTDFLKKSYSINRRVLSVPRNVFICTRKNSSSTVLQDLGYIEFGERINENGIEFSTWASQTALAYKIEVNVDWDGSLQSTQTLSKILFKSRPTLAINAFFIELPLSQTVIETKSTGNETRVINKILNSAVSLVGLDPPLHLIIVGLENFPDVYRAGRLNSMISEKQFFGGFLENDSRELPDKINELFSLISVQFEKSRNLALKSQLSKDFSASLIKAPVQIQLLKSQLAPKILRICQPAPPRKKDLCLHSIAFFGEEVSDALIDPLGQLVGRKFFSQDLRLKRSDSVSQDTIQSHLVPKLYQDESFAVRSNKRELYKNHFRSGIITIVLLYGLAQFQIASFERFKLFKDVNNEVSSIFNEYYTETVEITNSSKSSDPKLSDLIFRIERLRLALEKYTELTPTWYDEFLPTGSLETLYTNIYRQELKTRFQQALIEYLQTDMFTYYQVGDAAALLEISAIVNYLVTDQVKNSEELVSYFIKSAQSEGETDLKFLKIFKQILEELFALNEPRPEFINAEQNLLIINSIKKMDAVNTVYNLLMNQPKYRNKVNLRNEIGGRFDQLFVMTNEEVGLDVPLAFTRTGFNLFYKDGEAEELSDILNAYEASVRNLTLSEKNNISQKVKEKYTLNYIQTWTNLLDNIEIKANTDWETNWEMLNTISSVAANPIKGLFSMLKENIDLSISQENGLTSPLKDAGNVAKQEFAASMLQVTSEIRSIQQIKQSFANYSTEFTNDPNIATQMSIFLQLIRDLHIWLDGARKVQLGMGQYFFEQLLQKHLNNPLENLYKFHLTTEIPFLKNAALKISTSADMLVNSEVENFINKKWGELVAQPYAKSLETSFPFSKTSDYDLPLETFVNLFTKGGVIDLFENEFLKIYKTSSGRYLGRSTFLTTGLSELTAEGKNFLEASKDLRSQMFSQTKPHFKFKVRNGFMDPALSSVEINSGITLYKFSHGPIFWSEQTWPQTGIKDNVIKIQIFEKSSLIFETSVSGAWSWFRLLALANVTANPAQGFYDATFTVGDKPVIFQLNANSFNNPFDQDFFNNIRLPSSLFDIRIK